MYNSTFDGGEIDTLNSATTATSTTVTIDPAALFAGLMIFTIAIYVISSFLQMKIFRKAGLASWAAWVPVYNSWKLYEIGGQKGFWSVLAFIPFANIAAAVFMLIAQYQIGLKLGKSGAFVLMAVFLPIVWLIWLAFDQSTWDDSKGTPSLATGPIPAGGSAQPVQQDYPTQDYSTQAFPAEAYPAQPEQPAQPIQPVQPEQPTQPVQPTEQYGPNQTNQ